MWPVLVMAVLALVFAYAMALGTAWLDQCSDEDFHLLIWEAEPHRTAEAVCRWVAQVLIIQVWAAERGRVWLRIEGWIVFPWVRRLERTCQAYLADPNVTLVLDLARVKWISPGGRRLLQALDKGRVRIQRWPQHLCPLNPASSPD